MKNAPLDVVLGIICDGDAILISKRPLDRPFGGLWEFPGGKIEQNETPEQALVRELDEELGIQVHELQPFCCIEQDYLEHTIRLIAFFVFVYDGIPFGKENQAIAWVHRLELPYLEFPQGSQELIHFINT